MDTITQTQISRLIALAVAQHGLDITPAGHRASLEDCVTDEREYTGDIVIWYNTLDTSTHIARIRE